MTNKLKDVFAVVCKGAVEDGDGKNIPETYLKKTGDSKDNTASFTSADSLTPTAWTDVPLLATGEKHNSIFGKISTVFKNLRWIYKMIGTTDIASIGGGTLTGAVSKLNTDLQYKDISGEIIVTEAMSSPTAYIENGSLIMYAYIPTETKGSSGTLFKLPERYAPRRSVCGSIGYGSAFDVGKVVNVGSDTTGTVLFYIREKINYAVPFTIQYPLKRD